MNRDETIKILMMVQAAYPSFKPADKTVAVNLWQTMLGSYDFELVQVALQKYIAIDTTGYAPSIGQIIKNIPIADGENLNEMEAWAMVSKALRNGYYGAEKEFEKLPEIVQKAVGSPSNLRNWSQTDMESVENVIQSNFMRSYRAEVKRSEELKRMPESIRTAIEMAKGIDNGKNKISDGAGRDMQGISTSY